MAERDLLTMIREHLFSAVIGDVMDSAGLHHQFLPAEVRPIAPDMTVAGYAMPVQVADSIGDPLAADPFGAMFRALDDMKPDEIYLTAGGSLNFSLWGGLMSTRAQKLGAAGAIFDGYHRDTKDIIRLGFPVFSRGAYAQDQRGRGKVTDFRCPVTFANGVRAEPGDIVVGDVDGVVLIPKAHAVEIVRAALIKVEGEEDVRRMIEGGETTESVFARTGIM